jgi:hypothetical protein
MCCFIVNLFGDVKFKNEETLFSKALKDLARLIFEELDPGLSDLLMSEKMEEIYHFLDS